MLRSLITTLHQHLSQPLWWDSQRRPLSPTITPKSRLEPPRSPACRSVEEKRPFFLRQFTTANRWTSCTNVVSVCSRVPQLLQQLPTERVEQKEIPAEHMVLKSTFDSLVQRCQLAARDPVSLPWASVVYSREHRIHPFQQKKTEKLLTFSFSANEKETRWFRQTSGIPLRQIERAVGKK